MHAHHAAAAPAPWGLPVRARAVRLARYGVLPPALLVLTVALALVLVPAPGAAAQMPRLWAPAALGVALLLLVPVRWSAAVVGVIAVVTLLAWVERGHRWDVAAGLALGYAAASTTTWQLLRRGREQVALQDQGDVSRLIGAAAAGSAVATAGAAATSTLTGLELGTAALLSTFCGTAAAMVVLLPLFLPHNRFRPLAGTGERVGSAVVTLGAGAAVLSDLVPAPVVFAVMPMFAWHAFRGTLRDASLVLVGLSVLAGAMTLLGIGPIAALEGRWGLPPDGVNAVLQLFLLDCGLILLPISVVVTQQRRAAAKSAAERATLERLIFSAAGSAIVATGPDGRISVFNPAAEELWGYRAQQVIGEVPDVLWSDQELRRMAEELGTAPVVADLWQASVEQGRTTELWHSRRFDGSQHVAQIVVSPVLDEHGDAAGYMLTAVDVTERELAQQALLETLEHQKAAVERLQDLERVKGDFVATVSHELRTPITSIIGYTEVLEEGMAGELSVDQLDVVDRVDRNSRRLLSLVEDLLTLSEIETSRLEIAPEDIDLRDVARCAHDDLTPALRNRSLEVRLVLPSRPVVHDADPAQLRRMLGKLLGNAVKFTPDGGQVSLAVRVTDDGSELVVTDTGPGIPASEQDRLYDRFFRSQSATEQAVQGTGLGLTIVQAIAALHGGHVGIRSAEGHGTEVTVWLPARRPTHEPLLPVQGGSVAR